MAVILVHQRPDVTRERYNQVVRSMTGKDRVESPSDWPVEGLLVHAAGDGPDGFRVVDVWESEDPAQRSASSSLRICRKRVSLRSRRSIQRTRS